MLCEGVENSHLVLLVRKGEGKKVRDKSRQKLAVVGLDVKNNKINIIIIIY